MFSVNESKTTVDMRQFHKSKDAVKYSSSIPPERFLTDRYIRTGNEPAEMM